MICEALVLYFYWEKKKSPVISHLLVTVCCLLTAFMTWIVILRSSGRDKARQFEDADLLRDHRQTNTPSLLISHLPSSMSSSPTNSWQRLPWAMLSPASSIFFFFSVFKKKIFVWLCQVLCVALQILVISCGYFIAVNRFSSYSTLAPLSVES